MPPLTSSLADTQHPLASLAKITTCQHLIAHEMAQIMEGLANIEIAALALAKAAAVTRLQME